MGVDGSDSQHAHGSSGAQFREEGMSRQRVPWKISTTHDDAHASARRTGSVCMAQLGPEDLVYSGFIWLSKRYKYRNTQGPRRALHPFHCLLLLLGRRLLGGLLGCGLLGGSLLGRGLLGGRLLGRSLLHGGRLLLGRRLLLGGHAAETHLLMSNAQVSGRLGRQWCHLPSAHLPSAPRTVHRDLRMGASHRHEHGMPASLSIASTSPSFRHRTAGACGSMGPSVRHGPTGCPHAWACICSLLGAGPRS